MTAVSTRRWPLFALTAALVAVVFVLDGTLAGVAALAAFVAFFAACLRSVAAEMRTDPERTERLGRSGLIGL